MAINQRQSRSKQDELESATRNLATEEGKKKTNNTTKVILKKNKPEGRRPPAKLRVEITERTKYGREL